MVNLFFEHITEMLNNADLSAESISWISTAIISAINILILLILYYILSRPITNIINTLVAKTNTEIDDIFLSPRIIKAGCLLLVSIAALIILPDLSYYYHTSHYIFVRGCRILIIISLVYLAYLEVRALCIFLRRGNDRRSGVLVLRNILNTAIFSIASILVISIIMGRSPAYVLSTLGAMAAVLLLVFKDSILGMMAGIRLSINGMLNENDWITVPSHGADGRVEDVSLTVVKIRNWDKSISLIPPHSLLSGGFINRESMLELGVRQIRRAINIDLDSVRHLNKEEAEQFISAKWYPSDAGSEPVNMILFRRWLRYTLQNHPRRAQKINRHPLQVMARELPATPQGLPIEIFFFVDCPDWEEFEELQADLYDNITASLKRFSLRAHQTPTGADIRSFNKSNK